MRCANKVTTEAATRMRSAGEQAIQDSVAGVSLHAAANKQPSILHVAAARGNPPAASSSAASVADGSPMDVDPENEVVYSGESDPQSDSKFPVNTGRKAVGADTTAAVPRGTFGKTLRHEMFGSSDESED